MNVFTDHHRSTTIKAISITALYCLGGIQIDLLGVPNFQLRHLGNNPVANIVAWGKGATGGGGGIPLHFEKLLIWLRVISCKLVLY